MRLDLLPAGLAGALVLSAAAEIFAGSAPLPAAVAPPTTVAMPRATSAAWFTPRWASVILARPLFRADRRPPPIAAAVVDDTLPRLTAIVITSVGRGAVFAGPATGGDTPAVVTLGGRIGVYQLRQITPDSVSLLGPDGKITVHPTFASPGAAPP